MPPGLPACAGPLRGTEPERPTPPTRTTMMSKGGTGTPPRPPRRMETLPTLGNPLTMKNPGVKRSALAAPREYGSAFRSRSSSSSPPQTPMPAGGLGRPWPVTACALPAAVLCCAPSWSPSCSPHTGSAFGNGCKEGRASRTPPRSPLMDDTSPPLPSPPHGTPPADEEPSD